jgi:hypothetical protein
MYLLGGGLLTSHVPSSQVTYYGGFDEHSACEAPFVFEAATRIALDAMSRWQQITGLPLQVWQSISCHCFTYQTLFW